VLFDALERIAAGGCVIDAAVAEGSVARASALARIEELTQREREVLRDEFANRLPGVGDVDLHDLLDLVDRGCPPELTARILSPL